MRKVLVSAACALAMMVNGGAYAASDLSLGPTTGGFASDNVEHVTHIPINLDSAGARLLGDFFYITTSNGLTIYDVSEPEAPERLGFLPMAQQPYFAEEDVDTNGKILLISTFNGLNVVDVEDKSNPVVIGEVTGLDEHTFSCILGCKWAYGSEGAIVDLRDPAQPKRLGDWTEGLNIGNTHDVTEVKPGFVLTSTQPMYLLDVRKPDAPKVLARSEQKPDYMHANLWPNNMKDRFYLAGTESMGPTCDENDGALITYDTSKWQKTKTFKIIDEYRVGNGLPTEGDAAANLYCTHWFDVRPGYRNGGQVAMGWYEHGTRFFDINSKGKIEEIGFFLPYAGSTSAAYWIDKNTVYAVDYNRGIDILRFTD